MAFSREWAMNWGVDRQSHRRRKGKGGTAEISRLAALGQGPPPFHGPAAILSSAARDATFRDEGQVWNEFMPSAATARLMQSIFDAAVA